MSNTTTKPQKYKRFTPEPISDGGDTLDAVLSMAIDSLKAGRPPAYPETPEGLESFKQNTIDYFAFVRDTNRNPDLEKKLIPDVEGLSTFLGITRVTLFSYEQNRSREWREFIRQAKNAIAACKKELAFHQQIPPVIALFDLTNNHNYRNTSEFRLEAATTDEEKHNIASREEIAARYGITADKLKELPEPEKPEI